MDLGLRVKKINDLMAKRGNYELKKLGLTFSQFHCLVYLEKCAGQQVPLKQLENHFEVAQATMVSAAARKECRGAHTVYDYEHPADHPEHPLGRNDKEWLKHTLWDSATNSLTYKPVNMKPLTVESIPPKVRTF